MPDGLKTLAFTNGLLIVALFMFFASAMIDRGGRKGPSG